MFLFLKLQLIYHTTSLQWAIVLVVSENLIIHIDLTVALHFVVLQYDEGVADKANEGVA